MVTHEKRCYAAQNDGQTDRISLDFSDTLTEILVLESQRKKISSIWTRVAYFTHVSVIRQEKRMAPHFLGDVQIIREEIRST